MKAELGWFPKWNIYQTLNSIVKWNKAYKRGENMRDITINQINEYYL